MIINIINDFSTLSTKAVLEQTKYVRSQEVKCTASLIAHLVEIVKRKAFVGEGFSSLFDYSVKALGFSESEAALRSQVTYKVIDFPELLEYLSNNKISLTVAGLLSAHISKENASILLSACQGLSKRKAEEFIACLAPKPTFSESLRKAPVSPLISPKMGKPLWPESASQEKSITQNSQSHEQSSLIFTSRSDDENAKNADALRVTAESKEILNPSTPERYNVKLSITKEQKEKLDRLGELLGKRTANGNLEEIISFAIDCALEKKDPAKRQERRGKRRIKTEKENSLTNENAKDILKNEKPRPAEISAVSKKNNHYIGPKLRDEVLAKAGYRCEFKSESGYRCDRKTYLHIDHKRPLSFGGETTKENLQVLCSTHHQDKTNAEFG